MVEVAGRNQVWQMGKEVGASGDTGAWVNPGNQVQVGGFNVTKGTCPGLCAINCKNDNTGLYSFHSGVANAVFCDASVRSLSTSVDITVAVQLMTRKGGEIITANID